MFKNSNWASFPIILFQFLQYYFFVVLSCYCDSFAREENCTQNHLGTQRPFNNYLAFVVFSGLDFITNLSDGLKIMDPSFITCNDMGKLLCVTSCKHF